MVTKRDLRNVSNRMAAEMSVSFRTGIRNAGVSGMFRAGSVAEYIGRALSARQIPHEQLRRAHRDAGEGAQRSMVQGYVNRRHRRPVPSYRIGDRYAGGALLRALRNPNMVEATEFTLRFINTDILNTEARHWRRLNFGAGAGSEGGLQAPAQFPIAWEGMVVATLGLTPDFRPAFTMPQGIFVAPGGNRVESSASRRGSDMFFPRRASRRYPTAGIASSNFLDAGVRRLATALPQSYLGMYQRLYDRTMAQNANIISRVGAMPAPGPFRR